MSAFSANSISSVSIPARNARRSLPGKRQQRFFETKQKRLDKSGRRVENPKGRIFSAHVRLIFLHKMALGRALDQCERSRDLATKRQTTWGSRVKANTKVVYDDEQRLESDEHCEHPLNGTISQLVDYLGQETPHQPVKEGLKYMFKERIAAEIEFERRIARSPQLSLFRRNSSTWELLLLIASYDGSSDDGVYGTIEKVGTSYLGASALLKFLRERRADGSLEFEEHEKRSKRRIRLSDSLMAELRSVLAERNIQRPGDA